MNGMSSWRWCCHPRISEHSNTSEVDREHSYRRSSGRRGELTEQIRVLLDPPRDLLRVCLVLAMGNVVRRAECDALVAAHVEARIEHRRVRETGS